MLDSPCSHQCRDDMSLPYPGLRCSTCDWERCHGGCTEIGWTWTYCIVASLSGVYHRSHYRSFTLLMVHLRIFFVLFDTQNLWGTNVCLVRDVQCTKRICTCDMKIQLDWQCASHFLIRDDIFDVWRHGIFKPPKLNRGLVVYVSFCHWVTCFSTNVQKYQYFLFC